MNPRMHHEITELLDALKTDPEVKVLILTGAEPAFCAGMDLKEYFYEKKDNPSGMDREREISQRWRAYTLRMFPKPTIASVNGFCFGGGLSIVAACDLALAAEEATFGLSEVNFGQIPAGPVSRMLVELLNPRDAMWYSLTGETFDGRTAAEIGLVNKAVPKESLSAETLRLAEVLREKDEYALRFTKELIKRSSLLSYDDALALANTKVRELTHLQKGEWLEKGIGDFMAGKYRPGFGSYKSANDRGA